MRPPLPVACGHGPAARPSRTARRPTTRGYQCGHQPIDHPAAAIGVGVAPASHRTVAESTLRVGLHLSPRAPASARLVEKHTAVPAITVRTPCAMAQTAEGGSSAVLMGPGLVLRLDRCGFDPSPDHRTCRATGRAQLRSNYQATSHRAGVTAIDSRPDTIAHEPASGSGC